MCCDKVITIEEEVEDPATKSKSRKRVAKVRDDGHGFGVVAADVNDDGLIDLYVANDMNPNFLFLNRGDGTFDDATDSSGAAYDINGQAQSGMGVDAEDVDGDGLPELFVTNFANEYNTLYQNFGKGVLLRQHGLLRPGLRLDALGRLGLRPGGLRQRRLARLLRGQRARRQQPQDARPAGRLRGDPRSCSATSRGSGSGWRPGTRAAISTPSTWPGARPSAIIDNDGDIDIVVNHKDGAPALLRNDTKSNNHWVRFVLQGTKSNRDAIGAKLQITTAEPAVHREVQRSPDGKETVTEVMKPERTIHRQRKGGCSLQGTNDPRVLVGVGPMEEVKKVVIRWPSGIVTTLENLKVDQEYKVVEPTTGTTGIVVKKPAEIRPAK